MLERLIFAGVVLAAVSGVAAMGYTRIKEAGRAEMRQQYDVKLKKANDVSSGKEREMQRAISGLQAAKDEESKNAKVQMDALRDDVRSGAVRLSIAVARGRQATGAAGVASGVADQERAELLPETADALVSIAADADAEVRRTNLCIDSYNKVRQALVTK